jgi:hypothetical protein
MTSLPQHRTDANDDLDMIIADIWDRVLERGPAARTSSILELKVGVRRVHRLFSEITKATGIPIPVTVMFQEPTLDRLVALVRLGHAPTAEPLALLKTGICSAASKISGRDIMRTP